METAYIQAVVLVRFEEIHFVSVIEMYKQFSLAEILYVCDPFLVVFHFCNLYWTLYDVKTKMHEKRTTTQRNSVLSTSFL